MSHTFISLWHLRLGLGRTCACACACLCTKLPVGARGDMRGCVTGAPESGIRIRAVVGRRGRPGTHDGSHGQDDVRMGARPRLPDQGVRVWRVQGRYCTSMADGP